MYIPNADLDSGTNLGACVTLSPTQTIAAAQSACNAASGCGGFVFFQFQSNQNSTYCLKSRHSAAIVQINSYPAAVRIGFPPLPRVL